MEAAMKKTDGRIRYAGSQLSLFLCVTLLACHVLLIFSKDTLADMTEEIGKCAAIRDKDKRLECYDMLPRQTEYVGSDVHLETASEEKDTPGHQISMMEKLWDLDEESRRTAPIIKWHNPNYFLLASYNTTQNRDTMLDADPIAKAQNTEAVFQLSGKLRPLPDDLLGKKLDFWLGYTQLSFWQLYNSAFSAPFRDTNYAPEGFFTYRTNYNFIDLNLLNLRIINAGFIHQSNGRSRPLSRSWNRLFTEFGFEKIFDKEREEDRNEFNLYVKAWYRLPENSLDDDNADIEKYLGHGEIRGVYYWKKYRFGMMLRNNLQTTNNKGALQLDLSLPLSMCNDKISFYIQYFNGYGESLLDYNSTSNRIGAGIMVTDWR
jgi:phospholipase A1/A2